MATKRDDLIQRLRVAAGLEADGTPREQLDQAADPETEALAREHGSYASALAAIEQKTDWRQITALKIVGSDVMAVGVREERAALREYRDTGRWPHDLAVEIAGEQTELPESCEIDWSGSEVVLDAGA